MNESNLIVWSNNDNDNNDSRCDETSCWKPKQSWGEYNEPLEMIATDGKTEGTTDAEGSIPTLSPASISADIIFLPTSPPSSSSSSSSCASLQETCDESLSDANSSNSTVGDLHQPTNKNSTFQPPKWIGPRLSSYAQLHFEPNKLLPKKTNEDSSKPYYLKTHVEMISVPPPTFASRSTTTSSSSWSTPSSISSISSSSASSTSSAAVSCRMVPCTIESMSMNKVSPTHTVSSDTSSTLDLPPKQKQQQQQQQQKEESLPFPYGVLSLKEEKNGMEHNTTENEEEEEEEEDDDDCESLIESNVTNERSCLRFFWWRRKKTPSSPREATISSPPPPVIARKCNKSRRGCYKLVNA